MGDRLRAEWRGKESREERQGGRQVEVKEESKVEMIREIDRR